MVSHSSLAIVHFQPLEKYPPVMNMINYLTDHKVHPAVYSNRDSSSFAVYYENLLCPVIKRYSNLCYRGKVARMLNYFRFITGTSMALFRSRPSIVLYYESWSALPAIFLKIVRPETQIMVHYHEYGTPEEYRNGMLLLRISHYVEKRFIRKYSWISHTNNKRLEMFRNDLSLPGHLNFQLMPNYPPNSWSHKGRSYEKEIEWPVKIVYCGALGMKSTFIKDVCEWIATQKGNVLLDIYSQQLEEEVVNYLKTLNSDWISFKGNVNYPELPNILSAYDVGLILYKGLTKNYIYNAPNKLFEYLSCGLDVWYPKEMEGCHPYVEDNRYPKIVKTNFNGLVELNLKEIVNHKGLKYKEYNYSCEEVYEKFKNTITAS